MKNLAIVPGSKLLKAMGNARRLEILYYLMQNEMNVTELEKAVGLSQSALSQLLERLAQLVDDDLAGGERGQNPAGGADDLLFD